jgi:hypothetical protein
VFVQAVDPARDSRQHGTAGGNTTGLRIRIARPGVAQFAAIQTAAPSLGVELTRVNALLDRQLAYLGPQHCF